MAIVEPNELLASQTTEKLSLIHYAITVYSIDDFYKHGTDSDVVILDEYDSIINQLPYAVTSNGLTGVWALKEKKVIAFSATSAPEVERVVSNCISMPKVLIFSSEYELIHGKSPIQDGKIKQFKSIDEILKELGKDIENHYDKRPIILIVNEQDKDKVS